MNRLYLIAIAVTALAVASPAGHADERPATARGESAPEGMRSSLPATLALAEDPIRASFERMLTHEPNWVTPPLPAGFEQDPLIEAIFRPLWRNPNGGRRAPASRFAADSVPFSDTGRPEACR